MTSWSSEKKEVEMVDFVLQTREKMVRLYYLSRSQSDFQI